MPVIVDESIQILDQAEFSRIAFEVMEHAFAIHNELGRFFSEQVYQNEMLQRVGDRAKKEVRISVAHGDFRKPYRLDLLVDRGALFELKTVDALHGRHDAQAIHYLMLTGLRHAKLINFRPEKVEHQFVNCSLNLDERRAFRVQAERWQPSLPGCRPLEEATVELLRDWGTGLDVHIYEEAVTHFFGGPESVIQDIDVVSRGRRLGSQTVRLINPTTALKFTTLSRDLETFEAHTRRFLAHTELEHVAWVNVALGVVNFVVVSKR